MELYSRSFVDRRDVGQLKICVISLASSVHLCSLPYHLVLCFHFRSYDVSVTNSDDTYGECASCLYVYSRSLCPSSTVPPCGTLEVHVSLSAWHSQCFDSLL